MKTIPILCMLTSNVIAYDSIYVSFYAYLDCTGDQGGGALTDTAGWADIQLFQGFRLNRSMLSTE